MILQELEYEGFRNLMDAKLSFCAGLNIITGDNGAGKTNLLEAIFFSAYGTSFRTHDDRNMVKFNAPFMRVTGFAPTTMATIFYNGTKKLAINGNEKQRLSEYIGWLPCVVMSVNDIWIIRGAPVKRRNFLDWLLIKIHPVYGANLSEYRKILRQRNALLRQNPSRDLLEIYNHQFVHWANLIYEERLSILPYLQEKIKTIGRMLGLDEISFEYFSSAPDLKITLDDLKKNESKDLERSETTIGPHRDDFIIKINGRSAQKYASQGECRLLAILLRLIECEIIKQKTNQEPVYLLDEVTGELDHAHRKKIFELIRGQIFFATVQDLDDLPFVERKKIVLKRGAIAIS
ncbi:MAG: DNA replication and repair protein RecF [candidate division WOR-3 bacterium]